MPRIVNLRDPTFLGIALSLAAMLVLPGPMDETWLRTPRETQWMVMLAPMALAGLIAARERGTATIAVLFSIILFWPLMRMIGSDYQTAVGVCVKQIKLNAPSRTIAWLFFWGLFVAMLGLIARGAIPRLGWGAALARGGIGVGAMVASADLLEVLDRALWIAPVKVQDMVMLAQYWVPPVVLCALFWRRWRGIALWIGATGASFLWTAEMVFELNGLRWVDYPALGFGAAVGPLWAWCDWRRHAIEHRPQGFEVAPAPRPVIPLAETGPG